MTLTSFRSFALCIMFLALATPLQAGVDDDQLEPRGALGVIMVDIPPGLEDVFGTPTFRGAYVVDGMSMPPLNSGSLPTSESDLDYLQPGDLVTAVDGMVIAGTEAMQRQLATKKPRQIIRLKVIRDGKEAELRCRLSEAPPFRYIPADLCLNPSTGRIVGIEMLGAMFGAGPIFAIPVGSELTGCSFRAPACTAIAVMKQDETRTVVDIADGTYQTGGDWRRHTHRTLDACLAEKERLAALREKLLAPAP